MAFKTDVWQPDDGKRKPAGVGESKTMQDMADTYYGMQAALGPQLLPGYLQREPVNALDPYAHSGIDEPWEMIHDAPVVPENIPGRGYSNMLLGDKIAPWVQALAMLAGVKSMRGPQTNPTVPLRSPANTDLIKSTQAPGFMRPVAVDDALLGGFKADPLRSGAAQLYGAPRRGPWSASELEQQMLRAQYANYPRGVNIQSRQNEYNLLDDIPMVNVPRTAELARESAKINAQQTARIRDGWRNDSAFAPEAFPNIAPPAYGPANRAGIAALAGELAAGAAGGDSGGDKGWFLPGIDRPSWFRSKSMDDIPESWMDRGLLGLLPYRDENTPYKKIEDSDTNWREVWNDMLRGGKAGAAGIGSGAISAAKAGGVDLGLGDLAQWLWSQTVGKGYGE
jgi:hypothetical protein